MPLMTGNNNWQWNVRKIGQKSRKSPPHKLLPGGLHSYQKVICVMLSVALPVLGPS
jgi:hypothetical protein